jgi:carboxymethylenebutenolidase
MRLFRRIFLGALGIVAALLLFVAGSILVDALIGGGRVAALTNTVIENPNGPAVRAYVARPSTPGPHPAVIMVHEFWGLREELVGKADALAREGYVVVAPDVFRGGSTGWVPRAIWQVVSTPTEQVDGDLDAVFAWLAAHPDVQADSIAVLGFCFGGGTALRYSLHNPELAATAVFYGSVITDAERLTALSGPLLGVFGGADASIPVEEVHAFEQALNTAGVPNRIAIYDGQPHAFITSGDPATAGGAQAEAWGELVQFLGQSLAGQALAPSPHTAGTAFAAGFGVERAMHMFVCDLTVRSWRTVRS